MEILHLQINKNRASHSVAKSKQAEKTTVYDRQTDDLEKNFSFHVDIKKITQLLARGTSLTRSRARCMKI